MALLAVSATAASAQYGYRNNSGNSYYSSGSTVYGNNYNTGSSWSTTHSRGGNQYGIDSRGNSWNYNSSSGTYYNYGTGETRYRGQRY
jgi:hypothetical protein